jgi:hypothetical protein
MDLKAYINDSEIWRAILAEVGWSDLCLREKRYDAIVHLVTAADGAAQFYSHVSSHQSFLRIDTPKQAVRVDKRLVEAWIGHPHFTVIDNLLPKSFKDKIEMCLDTVLKFIGLPTPTSFYKKYLLTQDSSKELPKDLKQETFHA